MERPTTRKSVSHSSPRRGSNSNSNSNSNDITSYQRDEHQQQFSQRKKRRRKPKPFPGVKIFFLKLIHNRWFYRTILIFANLIFLVAIVAQASLSTSSTAATAAAATANGSLRVQSLLSSTAPAAFPFPPLRAPAGIKRVAARDLMADVGYKVKPQVIGVYFANHTSESYLGSQVLPTHLQRQLAHHVVRVPLEAITAQFHLGNSEDYDDGRRDLFEHDSCKAQYKWMQQSFPTCNLLHEADLTNMHAAEKRYYEQVRILGAGYWRDVWKVKANGQSETNILKTIRYKHGFEDRNYDRHRRDALAMERLTWSPNVIDIYSYCGNSGIFEYAPGGDIEEVLWYEGEASKAIKWNSTERLVVAFQAANAITDAHNSERNGIPAIVHTDITTSQFVHVDGIYKLNDFNRCRFLAKDTVTGEPCKFRVGNNPGTFRAPEEYAYEPENEKIDIYSLGNIFYTLLTELWPNEEEETKQAQRLVMRGGRPPIDGSITKDEDPAIKSLLAAMYMSWKQNPEERATAKMVRDYLEAELKKLGISADD